MARRFSIPPLAENNLIRNSCFGQGLSFFRHSGKGSAEVLTGPPNFCRLTGGMLRHGFDVDNQIHADPDSVFPWHGSFVFKFRARGNGRLRAGLRWRLSYFRSETEFLVRTTPEYTLADEFQEFRFEGTVEDHRASINDSVFFEILEGYADITGISLCYPEPCHEVTFDRPHIAALTGEEIRFRCQGAKQLLCCYGHAENELDPEIIDAPRGEFIMKLPGIGGEGFRFVGVGSSPNSRKSLFVSTPPAALLKQMRRHRFSAKGRHLLFFGDSLTAYDAGRNYTDIAGGFLPDSWSYTNAGIGGDDLTRLCKRLQCRPRTYRLEDFKTIWEKIPDEIFIFYGANDTKAPWRTQYKVPITPPELEEELLQGILEQLREHAPKAEITFIASPPGFFPYQEERNRRLREIGVQHSLFNMPEHVLRYNRIMRDFAAANGCAYLDFHRECARHPDLKSLFIPDDGVHMTLKGHEFLAAFLLRHLAERFPGKE